MNVQASLERRLEHGQLGHDFYMRLDITQGYRCLQAFIGRS